MMQHHAAHERAFYGMFSPVPNSLSTPGKTTPAVRSRRAAEDSDCRMAELLQILSRHVVPDQAQATLIIDTSQRVLNCGQAAASLLQRSDSPLEMRNRELVAVGTIETRTRLHRLLRKASGAMGIFGAGPCWLGISAQPLNHGQTIRITLSQITLPAGPQVESCLGQMFDLTRAEARLAAALVSGLSLTEAAKACGTGIGTARNYLTRVFRKTATNRQSQLVALICRAMAECPP